MGNRTCDGQLDLLAEGGCVICGSAFTTARQLKYCSKRCRLKASYRAQVAAGYRQGAGAEKRKAWMDANRERLDERRTEQRVCCRCGAGYATRWAPQRYCSQACWGATNRTSPVECVCRWCSETFAARKQQQFCSSLCHSASNRHLTRPPLSPLGPVRQAIAGGDWSALIEVLREKTTLTDKGCWEWNGHIDKSGYGTVITRSRGGKDLVHRVMAMAMAGERVPSFMPVHHRCANTKCINPDHLQVVRPHENVAEMLERNFYLQRIAELEAALETARS